MSTIADTLKQEISRVARKELKQDLAALRKLTTSHRSAIAALKREVKALQSSLKSVQKNMDRPTPSEARSQADEAPVVTGPRGEFNAQQLLAHRQKLGFTQAQMAQLVGASPLSISKWESGRVTPRAAQLAHIAAALRLGKRAANARLAAQID